MKKSKLITVLPFIISLFFYLLTICPTLYIGDDGEIVSAAYTLGISHPPGYPLYTILGKIFTYLPLSNIAFRINLLSAFFGSLTILLLFLTLSTLFTFSTSTTSFTFPTLFASLLFAFSSTFWSASLHVKGGIYTLNTFFIISLFYVLLINSPNLFGLLLGFGLANHNTLSLFIPSFLIFIYVYRRNWLKFSILKYILLLIFIGLSTYLYLIIRANAKPLMNWGDPYNLERAIYHIFRKQYGEISKWPHTVVSFINICSVYWKWLLKEFTPYLLILIPFGVYKFYKLDKKLFWIFMFTTLTTIFGMIYVLNFEITPRNIYVYGVFFIPSFMFISLFIGSGLFFLIEKLKFVSYVIPLFVLLPLMNNYSRVDLSKNYIACNYGINILKTVDKDGILFTEGDNQMFVLAYLQYVEGIRKDVSIYDDIGCIFKNIYGENFLRLSKIEKDAIRNKAQKEIIDKTNSSVYIPIVSSKRETMGYFKKEQNGILYKIVKTTQLKIQKDFKDYYNLSEIENNYEDYLVRDIIAQYYFAFGEYYFTKGEKQKSLEYFEKCGLVGYDSEWVFNNLGVVYLEKGFKEKALEYAQKSISVNPDSAKDHANLGVMFYQQGKYNEAINAYHKALELNSNYAEAYNGLGTVYGLANENDKSIKCYETAISLKPNYVEAIANMGIVYHNKGEIDKAIELYRKAIFISPNYSDAHNNLGVSYESKGLLDEALSEYRKSLEFNPNKPDAYHNIGVIYYKQGKYKEAITEWEKTLSLDPNYIKAKQNIELTKKKFKH
ncbi:MAG: tetratricopeptide repeat protein [Candidatus Firestonebacteria bacterium]